MANNPWIDYAKTYASENGITYLQAIRSNKCKAAYRKTKKGTAPMKGGKSRRRRVRN